MAKKSEPDTEYKGDPSAAWQENNTPSEPNTDAGKPVITIKNYGSDNKYGSDVPDDDEDYPPRGGYRRRIPEDKLETVDLNKPLDFSDDPIINADVFKNRRKMAWLSIWVMLGLLGFLILFLVAVLGLFFWKPEIMKSITIEYKVYLEWSSTFLGWGFSALISIVLAYMGVSAYFYNSYMRNVKK